MREGYSGKGANRVLFFGAGNGYAQLAKNRPGCLFRTLFAHCVRELGLSGLRFFGYFLLEEQKKVT
jgi:hypothetical protein